MVSKDVESESKVEQAKSGKGKVEMERSDWFGVIRDKFQRK